MNYLHKIIIDFELHSVTGIKECFENGVDPNQMVDDKPLVCQLINMYTRGPRFKECMKLFVDYGLRFDDNALLAVLLNDAASLHTQLANNKSIVSKKYLLDCAFTPLYDATLLHICAEYSHLDCAKVLIEHGADVNAKAGVDSTGFGAHTPIFHTVNQHNNLGIDVLKYLLTLHPDVTLTVKGLIWGKGYEWETFIPSVNPISYAMMGLLPQFQRKEKQIYEIVSLLMKEAYGTDYNPTNIPNSYLEQ
jgi:ankyrin repeat protein